LKCGDPDTTVPIVGMLSFSFTLCVPRAVARNEKKRNNFAIVFTTVCYKHVTINPRFRVNLSPIDRASLTTFNALWKKQKTQNAERSCSPYLSFNDREDDMARTEHILKPSRPNPRKNPASPNVTGSKKRSAK
jgi:hypothetical protein